MEASFSCFVLCFLIFQILKFSPSFFPFFSFSLFPPFSPFSFFLLFVLFFSFFLFPFFSFSFFLFVSLFSFLSSSAFLLFFTFFFFLLFFFFSGNLYTAVWSFFFCTYVVGAWVEGSLTHHAQSDARRTPEPKTPKVFSPPDNPTAGQCTSLFAPSDNFLSPSLCAPIPMVNDIVEGQRRRRRGGKNGHNSLWCANSIKMGGPTAQMQYGVKPDIF